MPPQTARYLDLVHQGRNDWWRYALGACTIAFFWLVLGYLPYVHLAGDAGPGPIADYLAVNFSIMMMLAGLAVAVKWVHGRSLLALVTPEARVAWRRVARGAAVWVVLSTAAAAFEHFLFADRYYLSFDARRFALFAVVVLVLTPIQSATEELVFRGYLMQGLALLTRRPLVIAVASSVVFAVPHLLNPEAHRHGLVIMAANYFAIGMVLAMVTLRDGRLELAIGLHAANNVFLALIANYEGSALATESVFTARELDPWYSLAALVVSGSVFYWWIFRVQSAKCKVQNGE